MRIPPSICEISCNSMMLESILLDNDVVLKMCAYGAADRLVEIATYDGRLPSILGVAGFSLGTQVRKLRSIVERDSAMANLRVFLDQAGRLEPTDREIGVAADMEEEAIRLGLELDTGESQLAAILLLRCAPLVVSGDKRALLALAAIVPEQVNGRFACLEQAVASAISGEGRLIPFRTAVCASRTVDKAIAICFSCSVSTTTLDQVLDGLRSYTDALRAQTGRLLIASDDLVAIAAKKDRVGFT